MTNEPAAHPHAKTIGEMNGPWAIALKVCLVIIPVMTSVAIAHMSWTTTSIIRLQADTEVLVTHKEFNQALEALDRRMDALPPSDWRDRIMKLEDLMQTVLSNQSAIQQDLTTIREKLNKS